MLNRLSLPVTMTVVFPVDVILWYCDPGDSQRPVLRSRVLGDGDKFRVNSELTF